jgi:hypothetical protein
MDVAGKMRNVVNVNNVNSVFVRIAFGETNFSDDYAKSVCLRSKIGPHKRKQNGNTYFFGDKNNGNRRN